MTILAANGFNVLIREAIKLAFLWASWVSGASAFVASIILRKWPEKENFLLKLDSLFLFWEMKKRFPTTVCTTPFREQHKRALTRIEREVGGPRCATKQEDKYIRVSSLRNRCFTCPQLAASLNGTCKTAVLTSTVKRWLRDAGLLGRVAKKKPYLRLANKRKRLDHTEEHFWDAEQVERCWRSAWCHLSSMVEVMRWSGAALVMVKWKICTR